MNGAPHPFPVDPWAGLRRAVVHLDAGRSDAALDECWNAWHALQPGDGGRVVAVFVMGMALARHGDARRVLRPILPAISYHLTGEMIGPLHSADTRPLAQRFDFPAAPPDEVPS